MLLFIAPDMVV